MKRLFRRGELFSFVVPCLACLVIAGCGDDHAPAPDITGPEVVASTPVDATRGVDAAAAVSISFSEPMDKPAVEAAFSTDPALPAGAFSWDATGTVLTFTPDTNFAESTDYTATLGAGASDLAGNPLAGDYVFAWRTALPHTVITLQSDYGPPSWNYGGVPSRDGKFLYWWENTTFYRVRIADRASRTFWNNRSVWGVHDDGTDTWVGNYSPTTAARVSNADPSVQAFKYLSGAHTIAFSGNSPDFAYEYFGNSEGSYLGYWNRSDNTSGVIPAASGYLYQSAVIGDRLYVPRGYVSYPGILVIDAVNNPTAVEKTLLAGDYRIYYASDICTDGTFLYVYNSSNYTVVKVDPAGTGTVVAVYSYGIPFTNMAMVDGVIYAGTEGGKHVFSLDTTTGSLVERDCTTWLQAGTGTPYWDAYNDGLWFGPQHTSQTDLRYATFLPRSLIESDCPVIP